MALFNFHKKNQSIHKNSDPDSSADDLDIIRSIYLFNRNKLKDYFNSKFRKTQSEFLKKKEKKERGEKLTSDVLEPIKQCLKEEYRSQIRIAKSVRKFDISKSKEPDKTKEIITGLQEGDNFIFDYLYEYELPKIVRFITLNSGNNESAEDIFQESLIIILEKVYDKSLKIKHSFSTYLYSIARNLWIEELKKNKKQISIIDEYKHIKVDFSSIEIENIPDTYEVVFTAIESLGDSCRKLLECFYFRKMDWEDIASVMGYSSAGSARNQKFKCIERIRSKLNVIN